MALAITIPTTLLLLYAYVMWIWRKCVYALPFAVIFLIEIVWGTISIVWIDHGVYISEQLRYSYHTGAAFRYILLIAPFAIIFPWKANKLIRKENKSSSKVVTFKIANRNLEKLVWYIGVVCILYLFTDMIIAGIPLFHTEIKKSNFYSMYSVFPFANMIHDYIMPVFTMYCGLEYAKTSKKGKIINKYFTAFLAIIIYQIFMKNKFYGLYDYVVWFIIPLLVVNIRFLAKQKNVPVKYIIAVLLCVSVFLFVCYNQYTAVSYTTGQTAIQYLMDRIFALQSHTFWGVDYNVQQGIAGWNLNILLGEIGNGFRGVSERDPGFGIAKVMYSVTSSSYANDMISTGFLFAGNFATVSLSYSGYVITFLLSIGLGYIVAYISFALYKYIKKFDLVGMYFTFWIYRRFYEYYRVGTLSMVLSWKMILIYIFVIFIMFLSKHYVSSRKLSSSDRIICREAGF